MIVAAALRRRWSVPWTLRTWIVPLLAAATVEAAAQGSGADAGPAPLHLQVGESVAICSTGAVICPVGTAWCDDTSVVAVGGDARGPVLTGTREGATLCSVGSASGQGFRRVFRVTVRSGARGR